jgi:predicted phage gp36 major capsid-like protein
MATNMPSEKASTLAKADADLASLNKFLEKATTTEEKNEIQEMFKELTAERARQVEYFDLGISKVNQFKSNACSQAKTAETSYANLVKDCRRK